MIERTGVTTREARLRMERSALLRALRVVEEKTSLVVYAARRKERFALLVAARITQKDETQ